MFKNVTVVFLLACTIFLGQGWSQEINDCTSAGRAALFDGTVSGLRAAHEIFSLKLEDEDCSDDRELIFLQAVTQIAMWAFRDDGLPIDSAVEFGSENNVKLVNDYYGALDLLAGEEFFPLNEHDSYDIPEDGESVLSDLLKFMTSAGVSEIESVIDELDRIQETPNNRFRMFFTPQETAMFFGSPDPVLADDIEVDYGEVLLLKGALSAIRAILLSKAAYDLYTDDEDMLIEKLTGSCLSINNDLLLPHPDFLKLLPTSNDPNDGAEALMQARASYIDAINDYLEAIDYILSEDEPAGSDPQNDELLFLHGSDLTTIEALEVNLRMLLNSLENDETGTYIYETIQSYSLQAEDATAIGTMELVFDPWKAGKGGSIDLQYCGYTPSEWKISELYIEDGMVYADMESRTSDLGYEFLRNLNSAHSVLFTPVECEGMVPYNCEILDTSLFEMTGLAQVWKGRYQSWSYTLPFEFPFYGTNYGSVHISTNGFLDFTESGYYHWDLASETRIQPLGTDLRTDIPGDYDIYIDAAEDEVKIRWKADYYGSEINFSVTLFRDGRIRFDYGPQGSDSQPRVGISNGSSSTAVLFENNYFYGFFSGTLAEGGSSITEGVLDFWGARSGRIENISADLVNTVTLNQVTDVNPIFGSSARYPDPVSPRDLLPEFDAWSAPLPGTLGNGLAQDATLGGILPEMTQDKWRMGLDLEPAADLDWQAVEPEQLVDGWVVSWTDEQLVINDYEGDISDRYTGIGGLDIHTLHMGHDPNYLYGSIALYDSMLPDGSYGFGVALSRDPYDQDALDAVEVTIRIEEGAIQAQVMHNTIGLYGYNEWEEISAVEVMSYGNRLDFRVPFDLMSDYLDGRFVSVTSEWNWSDADRDTTHIRMGQVGTVSGTVTYANYNGVPIFVQAYLDPGDPEDSIISATMITQPGPYVLEGIGIGWTGYVRAFTPLFGFNILNIDALAIEESVIAVMSGASAEDVNIVLNDPPVLVPGVTVTDQIDTEIDRWDIYAFDALKGAGYTLQLTRQTADNAWMILLARDGDDELADTGSQPLNWQCERTGTYYVKVEDYSWEITGGTYQILLTADPVSFADVNLKAAVEEALDITDPTPDDMLLLISLDAPASNIADLTGLEFAVNLQTLLLANNQIRDISPLTDHTTLSYLNLTGNLLSQPSYCLYLPEIEANNPLESGVGTDPNPYDCESFDPSRRYVDDDAEQGGDGYSWDTAFKYLQDALAVAQPGDEIWVAEGTYKPDQGGGNTPGDRYATFQLTDGVAIYGGFAFGGDWDDRDPEMYQTILSGDLSGNDVLLGDPADLPGDLSRSENSYHVVSAIETDINAAPVLDGVTVSGGNANGDGESFENRGGGIYMVNSDAVINDCDFQGNTGDYAGGIYCSGGSPTVTDCAFVGNAVSTAGGAMYNVDYAWPEIGNCSFVSNRASLGGAMVNYMTAATVTDCTFSDNTTYTAPINLGYGGAIYNNDAWPVDISRCKFSGNKGTYGGAIANYLSSVAITSCLLSDNTAYEPTYGGGVCTYYGDAAITNCTFSANVAYGGGGAISNLDLNRDPSYSATITNCILWGNTGSVDAPDIHHRDSVESVTVAYCDVEEDYPGIGNFAADPLFIDPGYWDDNGTPGDPNDDVWLQGDYHVQSGSPCINTGDPDYLAPETRIVIDEQHTFTDPLPVELNEANIDVASIVVTDATGTEIYQEGDDYTVTQADNKTHLDITTPGAILPNITGGQQLHVDYTYTFDPAQDATDLDSNPRIVHGRIDMGAYEKQSIFVDANLKAAVEAALGITDPTPEDMLLLISLDAPASNIADLTALEFAANLQTLLLANNQISDISPLADLTNLVYLDLRGNPLDNTAYSQYLPQILANNPGIDLQYDEPPPYGGGAGTMVNPYRIVTVAHWQELMSTPTDWDKQFVLTADLDLQGMTLTPVGNSSQNFIGVFDGDGYVVSNADIDMPSVDDIALFGYVGAGGQILNLGMENASINGRYSVGALVGNLDEGVITACYATGVVAGQSNVGGLLGEISSGGMISTCYSTCDVSGNDRVGGLAGTNSSNRPWDVVAINSYAAGNVTGSESVGGLLGSSVGVIIGSFWDMESTGQTGSAGGKGLTTNQMRSVLIFQNAGWANQGWVIEDGLDYPRLAWENTSGLPIPDPQAVPLTGSGIQSDPYQIQTTSDFALLSWHVSILDKHIILMNDLDLSGVIVHPLGDLDSFTGVFEGNGHVISNVTIGAPASDHTGLFGYIGSGAIVHNLGVENINVTGTNSVGGLAGYNYGGTIESCYATGTVIGSSNAIGGLIGESAYGTIISCYADCSVSGGSRVGGILGSNWYGELAYSYAVGLVTGSSRVGGLLGNASGSVTVRASFWDVQTTNQAGGAGGKGLTTLQMQSMVIYQNAGWGDKGWIIEDGLDYPHLAWENTSGLPIPDPEAVPLSGFGTQGDPYQIHTAADFALLSSYASVLDKHITLMNDVDLSGVNLSPIGDLGPFIGVFEGNDHVISNGNINSPDNDNIGLFGYVGSGGQIHNLGVMNVDMIGRDNVGALIGYTHNSEISSCYATGLVNGTSRVGGLIGYKYYGSITSSHASVTVNGTSYDIGGLVGINHWGTITSSYATGEVTGFSGVGGLAGECLGEIKSCFATGAVSGSSQVGGLVGFNNYWGTITSCYATGAVSVSSPRDSVGGLVGTNSGTITICYSSGAVSGSSSDIGGLAGRDYGTITASFWDIETSGMIDPEAGQGDTDGMVGLPTAEMQEIDTFLNAGWDFVDTWWMPRYPELKWQATEPVIFADANLQAAVEQALGVANPTPDHMLNLTSLDASGQNIVDLTGIGYASNLTLLHLENNQITVLPPEIWNLTKLELLDLSGNQLTSLPAQIENLSNLQILHLDGNQLTSLPEELWTLTGLKEVSLGSNPLPTVLPTELWSLTSLTMLDLTGLQLDTLPPQIADLEELTELHLAANQISDISPLTGYTTLEFLDLTGNPLSRISYCLYIPEIEANNPLEDGVITDPNPYNCAGFDPSRRYVDDDAEQGGDGYSWDTAFKYLQDALAVSQEGDTIWVAEGVYKPDEGGSYEPGDRDGTFQLTSGVALYGSFPTGGDWNDRDPERYETILSGDLAGDDQFVEDPADLPAEPTRAENSYHVVTGSGTDETAVLDGFTITGGNANGSETMDNGGGMQNEGGSPTVMDCVFRSNSANAGGAGMYNISSSPTITDCTFTGNFAAEYGGAMSNSIDSNPHVADCQFDNNKAANGGAIINAYNSAPTIEDCQFNDNEAVEDGGAIVNVYDSDPEVIRCIFERNSALHGAGMVNVDNSNPSLTDCTFRENTATEDAGAIDNSDDSSPLITGCEFIGNRAVDEGGAIQNDSSQPTFINCIFAGNKAMYAGAIRNETENESLCVATFVNCTFTGNRATSDVAISSSDSTVTLRNCILWDDEPSEIDAFNSTLTVTYSNVQGGWAGVGNIDADPLFADSGYWDDNGTPADLTDDVWINGNYHLKSQAGRWDPVGQAWLTDLETSPCIDAGDPATPVGGEAFPNGGLINMGVYGGTNEASKSVEWLQIVYVDAAAPGNNNGSDWPNAFVSLQDAIEYAVQTNELITWIWVAAGIYTPDQGFLQVPGDRTATFQLTPGIGIYGGFAGTESLLRQRNVITNATVLSGDLNGDDDTGAYDDNSYHIITATSADLTAVLDGFVIRGGNGSGVDMKGSGLLASAGGATVRNCTFEQNYATCAAAIDSRDSEMSFEDIMVRSNTSDLDSHTAFSKSNVNIQGLFSMAEGQMNVFAGMFYGAGAIELQQGSSLIINNTDTCSGRIITNIYDAQMGPTTIYSSPYGIWPGQWWIPGASLTNVIVAGEDTVWCIAPDFARESAVLLWLGNELLADISFADHAEAVFKAGGELLIYGRLYDGISEGSNVLFEGLLLWAHVDQFHVRENVIRQNVELTAPVVITPLGGFLVANDLGLRLSGKQMLSASFGRCLQNVPATGQTTELRDFRNDIETDGASLSMVPADLPKAKTIISSEIIGAGTVKIQSGSELRLADGMIRLQDAADAQGTIEANGKLIASGNAFVKDSHILVNSAAFIQGSEVHYNDVGGEFFVEGNVSITNNIIEAEGDRYLNLDPAGYGLMTIQGNKITVTIPPEELSEQGTLLELRGRDFDCGTLPDPNCMSGAWQTTIDNRFDNEPADNWVFERLELKSSAKLNLTNRRGFEFNGPSRRETLYVRELVLGPDAVLNTALYTLYYEDLILTDADGNEVGRNPQDLSQPFVNNSSIVDIPLLGFSLKIIHMNDQEEYDLRVDVRVTDPADRTAVGHGAPLPKGSIVRLENARGSDNGVMEMATRGPDGENAASVAAKGAFARAGDEDVTIEFEYRFMEDPHGEAELVVYLSDAPEVGDSLMEVARIRPPATNRAGAVGSTKFAIFSGTFARGSLNFTRGTYVELELRGRDARCWIDNWDPAIRCGWVCGDYGGRYGVVSIEDYLLLLSEFGLSWPVSVNKGCLDLINDGVINVNDLMAWDIEGMLNVCPAKSGHGLYDMSSNKALVSTKSYTGPRIGIFEPLVVFGKPAVGASALTVPRDYLYSTEPDGTVIESALAGAEGRVITDTAGRLYQIRGNGALVHQSTGSIVFGPKQDIAYKGSTVSVGYTGNQGVPMVDAVFSPNDPNIVYVLPVLVTPQPGATPYKAAAKLALSGNLNDPNYTVEMIYGMDPNTDPAVTVTLKSSGTILFEQDVQHLSEIEVDSDGNLYILSVHGFTNNKRVLMYDERIGNPSETRISLDGFGMENPAVMLVSSNSNKLYLTSCANESADLATEVYRFSIVRQAGNDPNLELDEVITVDCPDPNVCGRLSTGCDSYVATITAMTENPDDGTVYATGFTAPKFAAEMAQLPSEIKGTGIYTTAMLAEIPADATGSVTAKEFNDMTQAPIVLPVSIVWTGGALPKCSGADISGDGKVDIEDFAIMVSQWFSTSPNLSADIAPERYYDEIVDALDLAAFATYWLHTDCN